MAARKNDKRKYPANAVHYPHRNGSLCGLTGRDAPTDARSYTVDDPEGHRWYFSEPL